MSKIKVILLSMCAVLAVTAVSATAASAAEWKNETGVLVSPLPLSETAITLSKHKILFHKSEIQVECPTLTVSSGQLETAGKNSAKSLTFSNCSVVKPASCEVTGGKKIATAEVTSLLTSATNVEFNPKIVGGSFATFSIGGASCTSPLKGSYTVKGKTAGTLDGGVAATAESCKASHALTIAETNGTLEVASEKVNTFEVEGSLSAKETTGANKCYGS